MKHVKRRPTTNVIGKRLRELRGDTPMWRIGQELGLTKNAIQNYEAGIRVPVDAIKVKYAELYGVSIQELFFDGVVYDWIDTGGDDE